MSDPPDEHEEIRAIEAWFAERGYALEYELTTGGVLEPGWMAVVVHADRTTPVPAYITGYGATKLEAARSAYQRFLRQVS